MKAGRYTNASMLAAFCGDRLSTSSNASHLTAGLALARPPAGECERSAACCDSEEAW